MNVVDSSAWLEYFADGPNAEIFAKPIEATRSLLVPSLSLFEVFKRVSQQRDEDDALRAVAVMEQGRVIDLDRVIASGSSPPLDPAHHRHGGQRHARHSPTPPRNPLDSRFGFRRITRRQIPSEALV